MVAFPVLHSYNTIKKGKVKMKIIKKFGFWLALFALIVNLFHLLGFDGDNYLIYFATPLLVLEDYSYSLKQFFVYDRVFWAFIYILNIGFWLLVGSIIDWLISKIKKV